VTAKADLAIRGALVISDGAYARDILIREGRISALVEPGASEAQREIDARGLLALPGIVAGSIFTFSLTLGDYITPVLIGGASSQFIGNVVYDSVNQSSNLPFGAAFAVVPVVVMGVYLMIARRLGAFEAL
jgi:ABC-type spermidine/putrescine transport system permease subunit II